MWTTLSVCLAVALAAPQERLLFLLDDSSANLERQLVQRELLHNLMRDPAVEVFTDAPWPPGLLRGVSLALSADSLVAQAKQALQALNPQLAASLAAAASLRHGRVMALGGDPTQLACALSLQAAAYLYLGADRAAAVVLARLLDLEPSWQPDSTLFNPTMLQAVDAARARAHGVRKRKLTVNVAGDRIAVFVDGHLRGFGTSVMQVAADQPHAIWAVPDAGDPIAFTTAAEIGLEQAPLEVNLAAIAAPPAPHGPGDMQVIAASRLPTGVIDPHARALAARRIDTVLVLAYHEGALRLVTFDLARGLRQTRAVPAAITDLWDVARVAGELLAAPPALIAP